MYGRLTPKNRILGKIRCDVGSRTILRGRPACIVATPPQAYGIVVFCIRDYISRIQIHLILMEFLETSDCTDESRKEESYLQFKRYDNPCYL